MGQTADTVAVEVEARLNTASAKAAEAQFDTSMDRIAKSAGKAEAAVTSASDKMSVGLNGVRGNSARLGVQIGQLGSSLGSGMNPMVVFAQQASDFAYVLNGTAGAAGKVAAFFSSPWGAALLSAGVVTSILLMKHHEHVQTLQDILDKMKANAAQAALNAQAERIWQTTTEGLTEAIKKRREELEKALQTDIQAEQAAKAAADADIARAKAHATVIQGQIADQQKLVDQRRRELTQAESGATSTDSTEAANNVLAANQALQNAQAELQRRKTDLTQTLLGVWNAEAESRAAQATISQRNVEAALDPVKKATDNYTRALGDLNAQLRLNTITQAEYDARLLQAAKTRNAAVEAAQKAKQDAKRDDADLVSFARPVAGGRITGTVGEQRPGHTHAGVDLAVPVGTPVSAAAGGVVIESGNVPGYGNVIVIDHGRGTISRYAHLSQLGAAKGTVVEQGQQIGLSGGARGAAGAGNSQGPHLHFEVREGGRPVDPLGRTHPVDALASNEKAQQIAHQLQQEHEKELAQNARFDNEMQRLQDQELAARRGRLETVAEQLAAEQAQIVSERDRAVASYTQAAQQHQITAKQAELLIAEAQRVAAAKALALADAEAFRRTQLAQALYGQQQQAQVDQLQFEVDNTKTGDDRRRALLALLDAETTLQRIRLQQTIDATASGTAEHELAVLKLAQLNDEKARRQYAINNASQNLSPGQQYRQQLMQTAGQIDEAVDKVTVDGLTKMNDEITSAIMGTESLGEAFDNVADQIIASLIRIAVQQAIIKPLADLLFGPGSFEGGGTPVGGGGGGGFLGAAASFLGSLFGGGRAGGGNVQAGRMYWVGENGPEPFIPGQSGTIIPNHAVAAMAGGGGNPAPNVVSLTVNAPGATAETVAMIRRELQAAAPTLVAAAQRSTVRSLTRTRT